MSGHWLDSPAEPWVPEPPDRPERHDDGLTRYTLTATWKGKTETRVIEAAASYEALRLAKSLGEPDPEASAVEFDAVGEAIMLVMNLGSRHEMWAKGRIELRDEQGALIHEMPAKDQIVGDEEEEE